MNTNTTAIDRVTASEDLASKIRRYHTLTERLNKIERAKNALKQEIMEESHIAAHIMDSQGKELGGWAEQVRNILDMERFKTEKPKIYDAYLKENHFFVFYYRGGK